MKRLGTSKSYRETHGLFLCDGEKLLSDAVNSGAEIETVITAIEIRSALPKKTSVYYAEINLINSLSPLKNSQGILFTCRIPKDSGDDYFSGTHILMDGVQDPGNVGTIIRSAYAFGIDSLILAQGTADPYNPKAIRASMGAIFSQRFCTMSLYDIQKLKHSGKKFIGTSNDRKYIDVASVNLNDTIIVLGNEGQGISTELLALCDEMVTIRLTSSCDSLNVAVAASIIMWEAKKKK